MKHVPFSKAQIDELAARYPTPFYVYDEAGIRTQIKRLQAAFSWNPGFKEYFAVKALPNPAILAITKGEGCGADCSSLAELLLAERVGITGTDIMFTSNDTPPEEFQKATELSALINLDDVNHLAYLERAAGLPTVISFRYNPGPALSGNAIIGDPKEAKFGVTREQLFEGYRAAQSKDVRRFGLHTMIISNELNAQYFVDAARMIFAFASEIEKELGIAFEFINLGGGIGIPYRPEQKEFDLDAMSRGLQAEYAAAFPRPVGPKIFLESGRFITGPYGYLVTRVRHVKHIYKDYVGVDATMADLMRPGMYGAYHHATVLGKGDSGAKRYDIVGSLCENNDKFAIDRMLPEIEPGDIIVIHDAGAHGHAMGFNYNGKLRHAEFLMHPGGSFDMIRRAETLDDHFATLDF